MASRTPSNESAEGSLDEYLLGWAAISERLRDGESWSGRERNCIFRNTGSGVYEDISGISGLDLADDGRSVVSLDWDGDGDLDFWFKNRSGPQLRLFLNQTVSGGAEPGAGWVSLRLRGSPPNTDAVGARVSVRSGERTRVRSVRAGEGYLAQSSTALHFGLADAGSIDWVRIRWPDGRTEELTALSPGNSYVVHRQAGEARVETEANPGKASALQNGLSSRRDSFTVAPSPIREPIVLRTPLPLPPAFLAAAGLDGEESGPALINLWAEWCDPCREELTALAERREEFRRRGIRIATLNIDEEVDRELARSFLSALGSGEPASPPLEFRSLDDDFVRFAELLLGEIVARPQPLPVPFTMLIDGGGRLQSIYLGASIPERFLADAQRLAIDPVPGSRRAHRPGRWFYRSPRNPEKLGRSLRKSGLEELASFYLGPGSG